MRGRWAQGLEPRYFSWIIKDRLAASERPGGFARNHRKVRRQEELIWLAGQGFTHVLSLLDSPHNLHAYEEASIAYQHVPLGRHDELPERLREIYSTISGWLDDRNERVLIHHEEFGDRLLGVLTGYLLYAGLVAEGPHAIVLMERLTGRQLGSVGREIVAVTAEEEIFRHPRPMRPRTPPPGLEAVPARPATTRRGSKKVTKEDTKKVARKTAKESARKRPAPKKRAATGSATRKPAQGKRGSGSAGKGAAKTPARVVKKGRTGKKKALRKTARGVMKPAGRKQARH